MTPIPTYTTGESNLPGALERLRSHLTDFPNRLNRYSVEEITAKATGKWSQKEVVGHLIDSAVNNLKRFTDAQISGVPYTVQPYDQDQLVRVNQYQQLPMAHLLTLWQALNAQILFVIGHTPENTLRNSILLSDGSPATLTWLIEDYIAHMEHHFKTLF